MTFTMYEARRGELSLHVWPSPHKTLQFPAGEQHIQWADEPPVSSMATDVHLAYMQGASSDDLVSLAMWAQATRGGGERVLLLPYLPGARQDRGRPLGAKVYADLINSFELSKVICFDPHSDVMPALLNRCVTVGIEQLPYWTSERVAKYVGVIAPDAGARKRAEAVAGVLGVPVYQALKHRDFATGKLSGFTCEELPEIGQLLLVDDICDGGGTFVGLADGPFKPSIDATSGQWRFDLWVSHGVFSKGVGELTAKYRRILTTDSHPGSRMLPDRSSNHRVLSLFDLLTKEI